MPKLTDRFLGSFTVEDTRKDRLVFDTFCPGLGVRVTRKGTRTFLVQWTDPSTRQKIRERLGVWGNLTIEQARAAARARLGEVAKGINPRQERERLRAEAERERAEFSMTLEALVSEWANLHLRHRRPRYSAEAQRAIRYSLGHLLRRPAARITRADAVNALDKLVADGKSATAGRTLAYARAAFSWAEKRGKVSANPFRGLPITAATQSRDRVLSDEEVGDVWAAAGRLAYPWGQFFKMALLTLQRREEVAGMRWSEISSDRRVWTIPAARMKNRRPHDVHLSPTAREVLSQIVNTGKSDFVFTTTGKTHISGFSKAKAALDTQIAAATRAETKNTPWRLHDFRRTGVSTLARLGFDSIVVDKILAHQPAKLHGVAGVYQRHDFVRERARALDAWAEHVVRVKCDAGNVIRLRGA